MSARTIRFFWIGDTRANTLVRSATAPSAGSDMRSTASPRTISPGVEADLLADLPGHQLVVPGDDLDLDPVRPQRAQGLGRPLVGRIEKGGEAHEDEVPLVGDPA